MTRGIKEMAKCNITGCQSEKVYGRGMCRNHYSKWYRTGSPHGFGIIRDPVKRYENSYEVIPTGCHIWTGAIHTNGYGQFMLNDKTYLAHRIAYEMHKVPIPKGMHVLHKCDVRLCVNPEHLFLGTHQDNMADKVKKGRQSKGETHGLSKLTEKAVIDIRRSTERTVILAKRYGVTTSTIEDARSRETWRHI